MLNGTRNGGLSSSVLDAIGDTPMLEIEGVFERHEDLVDSTRAVDSQEAVESMRRLAKRYGLFVGPSSGANLLAAKEVRESYPEFETVVTLFCDEGEKYVADHFAEKDTVRVDAGTFT